MLLTGPFTVTANQSTTLNDPSPSSGSVAVQIQNGSSFSLTVYTLGRKFDLGANTAATVPAYNGVPITLVTGASGASGSGVSALWLFPGEFNPQHDGAIPSITTQGPTTVGEIVGTDFYATGLPGATAGARFVGGTTGGPPITGTFSTNDFVVDDTGVMWVCTAGGSPGSWYAVGLPNLPPPVTSGTAVQTFTDATGHLWVAKNGVNSGGWRNPRDVLHAAWQKNNTWNTSATAAVFNYDTAISDPYGMITNAAGFTCPLAGVWRCAMTIGAAMTAAGQYLQCNLRTSSGTVINASDLKHSGLGAALDVTADFTQPLTLGAVVVPYQLASVAGLVGSTGVFVHFTADYLGTG